MVSLSSYIPDAEDSPSESSSAVAGSTAEEFPPLPGTAPAPPPPPAAPTAAGATGSSSGQAGGAPAAAAAGDNPLLAAFAAERQLMEQLRDDVQAKLASFKVRRLGGRVWRLWVWQRGPGAFQAYFKATP